MCSLAAAGLGSALRDFIYRSIVGAMGEVGPRGADQAGAMYIYDNVLTP